MTNMFYISAAVETVLIILEGTMGWKWLPLGGSHLAQLGILLGTSWVAVELVEHVPPAVAAVMGGG